MEARIRESIPIHMMIHTNREDIMDMTARAIALFFGRILFSNDASPPASAAQREDLATTLVVVFVLAVLVALGLLLTIGGTS